MNPPQLVGVTADVLLVEAAALVASLRAEGLTVTTDEDAPSTIIVLRGPLPVALERDVACGARPASTIVDGRTTESIPTIVSSANEPPRCCRGR